MKNERKMSKNNQQMKPFKTADIRELIDAHSRGEISYSKMVELFNKKAMEYYQGENNREVNYEYSENKDSIVASVINQFKERSEVGIKKYGVTLDREDLSLLEWLEHAKQESMDQVLYLEKAIQELKSR